MNNSQSDELYLYNLTLQKQSNYIHSCIGHFIDDDFEYHGDLPNTLNTSTNKFKARRQPLQLVLATETHIELFDVVEGELKQLVITNIFGTITKLKSFIIQDYDYHLIALTSDSGNLTILRYVNLGNKIKLETLLNQPLTRSGLRRISPISHLEVEPNGRCLLLCASERNKMAFLMNYKDGKFQVTSPMEIKRPDFVTLDLVACEVNNNNPCFISLEIDTTSENRDIYLVYYSLDIGLNQLARKANYKLHSSANFIMSLPDVSRYEINSTLSSRTEDSDKVNPFTIIGFDDYILLKDMQGLYSLKVQIPRPNVLKGEEPIRIISSTIQEIKKDFLIILQSQYGDLYKVKIYPNKSDRNRPVIALSYFDTVKPTEQMHIFRNGYLYLNSDYGSAHLLQFSDLGEDIQESQILSSNNPQQTLTLERHEYLEHFIIVNEKDQLNPLISSMVSNNSPLTLTTKKDSTLKVLSNSINFKKLITAPLPPSAEQLWSIKLPGEKFHKLLFLGFLRTTKILKIESNSIEELNIPNNPFNLKNDKTLHVCSMGNTSIIQVCGNEMRQIAYNKSDETFTTKLEWFPPAGIRVVAVASTNKQLAIALSNFEIVYFEVDSLGMSDSLNELQSRIEIESKITCIDMGTSKKSDFLSVGCDDSLVRIVSLNQRSDSFLEVISMQTLHSAVKSLALVHYQGNLQLHVGQKNGVYVRSDLNTIDGQISNVKTKFLGTEPVTLAVLQNISMELKSNDNDNDDDDDELAEKEPSNALDATIADTTPCVIVISSDTFVSYEYDSVFYIKSISLINGDHLKQVTSFSNTNTPINGCCSLSSSGCLVIGKLSDFISADKWFNVEDVIAEEILTSLKDTANNDIEEEDSEEDEDEEKISLAKYQCREMISLKDTVITICIENNTLNTECRFSIFSNNEALLNTESKTCYQHIKQMSCLKAVTTSFGKGNYFLHLSTLDGKIVTFELRYNQKTDKKSGNFNLLRRYETVVKDKVNAMANFRDMLVVPLFGNLKVYQPGKKQLTLKFETITSPSITNITSISVWKNQRLAIGDIRESVTLFIFNEKDSTFIPIADDIMKRWVTCVKFIDKSTVIGGDRFGNIWTLRLPAKNEMMLDGDVDLEDPKFKKEMRLKDKFPNIMECPFKMKVENQFFINDIVLNIEVVKNLNGSANSSIIYSGLQGTVGCLVPILSRPHLESLLTMQDLMRSLDTFMFMRQEEILNKKLKSEKENQDDNLERTSLAHNIEGSYSLIGRDQLEYRSYYAPVKNVIDGDLCEQFLKLRADEQDILCHSKDSEKPLDFIKLIMEIRYNNL